MTKAHTIRVRAEAARRGMKPKTNKTYPVAFVDMVRALSKNFSDKEIAEMFAKNWDSLAQAAVESKNNATEPAMVQVWHEAFQRRNKRALFWWGNVQ